MNYNHILYNMEKTYNKMNLYTLKNKKMGLSSNETKRYYELGLEYLKLELNLWDKVFDEYILDNIIDVEIEQMIENLNNNIKWKFNILLSSDDIKEIKNQYNKNKNKKQIMMDLANLHFKLKDNLNYYYNNDGQDLIEEISLLFSNDKIKNKDIIMDYLDYKFSLIYQILECKKTK